VSRVNLKLKFQKSNYLTGSYDVGRLRDENLRKIFQEHLNTKLESLKFDNVEDGWNNFRKSICEVVDDVLGRKLRLQLGTLVKKIYV
jgi:hypothetical protein